MSKSHKIASEHFPQLYLNALKIYAFTTWADQYPEYIKCITLYKYSFKPKEYAVVFEVSDIYQSVELNDRKPEPPLITEDLSEVYREGHKHNFKDEWIFFVKLQDKESHCLVADPQADNALISTLKAVKDGHFNVDKESEDNFNIFSIHEPHVILYQRKYSEISEAEEAFDKAVEEGEIEEDLENLKLMKPSTIREYDIKKRGIEELESELRPFRNYFSPKEAPETKMKLRPNQRHKIACREVAKRLWDQNPELTIANMIFNDEINKVFEGKTYADDTIRNWIKDLCPDRSPGRRPNRST